MLGIERGGELQPIEVKSGATVGLDALHGLKKWQEIVGQTTSCPCLIYGGDEVWHHREVDIIPWYGLASSEQG